MTSPRIAVIGAGPAGLMAAERLAMRGHAVTVHEAMPSPARKLLMAGRGGLNLTHSEDYDRFVTRYRPLPPTLAAALAAFTPDDARAWADGLGAETFTGSSGRVFPKAMKASPLLRAWLARLQGLGVTLATRTRWRGWDDAGSLVFDSAEGVVTARPDAVVLALGGASWPRLGSDGGWVPLLEREGVAVAPLRSANAGFRIGWSEVLRARAEGRALKRIALSFAGETVRGEVTITAQGLEGGPVYALSGTVREAVDAGGGATIALDLRPDLTSQQLRQRLKRPRGGQSLSTFLRKTAGLDPMAVSLLREAGAVPYEAGALAARIKTLPFAVSGLMPIDRAISSAGGVAFSEVDGGLMLTRRPGVFVAGEMLDWDAPTGGYLLQACLATGSAAAEGVAGWLERGKVAKPDGLERV